MKRLVVLLTVLVASACWGQFPFLVAHFGVESPAGGGAGALGTAFDASVPDYLSHSDSTGWSDSTRVTVSCWFRRDSLDGTQQLVSFNAFSTPNLRFRLAVLSSDVVQVFAQNVVGATVLNVSGSTPITDDEWHHVLFSCDLADPAQRHLYLDDVAETPTWTTYTNSPVGFTTFQYWIGRNTAGSQFFDGALSEVYLDVDTYWDFDVEANRRAFITGAHLPEDLGGDGSVPTGASPELYLGDGRTQTGSTSAFAEGGSPTPVAGPNP